MFAGFHPINLKTLKQLTAAITYRCTKILVKQKLIRDCDPKQGKQLFQKNCFSCRELYLIAEDRFLFRVQSYNLYFTKMVVANHSLLITVFWRGTLATTNCKYTRYLTEISIKVRCYFKEALSTIHSSGTVIVSGRHLQ